MTNIGLVALGGAVGAVLRHLTGLAALRLFGPGFPWGTLTVNIIGGFAMGLLAATVARLGPPGEAWRLLLGTGVLGGFTTFSAFSLETALMIERGAVATAGAYAIGSVALAVGALCVGLAVAR